MTKRGRLSKEEKSYIEDNLGDGVEDIASSLDRSEAVVQKHIDETTVQEPNGSGEIKAGDLMARNEKYGAVVMTEGASMAGDESKISRIKDKEEKEKPAEVNVATRHRGSIHTIKGN